MDTRLAMNQLDRLFAARAKEAGQATRRPARKLVENRLRLLFAKCGGEGSGKPGPCPDNKPEPAHEARTPHHDAAVKAVASALQSASIPEQHKKVYGEAAQAVIGRLRAKAAERLSKTVSGVNFYTDIHALSKSLAKECETLAERVAGGFRATGAFNADTGELHLDGGGIQRGENLSPRQVYAHEYGHAIDGRHGSKISERGDWKDAWEGELKGGGLTEYAGLSPSEGFAEFSRLVHASKYSADEIGKHFPRCAAVWKQEGLL